MLKKKESKKILAEENNKKRKSREMSAIDIEISEHLRLVSFHSNILREKMAQRSAMMPKKYVLPDNLPVITPENLKQNDAKMSACCSCGVIDEVKRQRHDHICYQCKLKKKSYARKASNHFKVCKKTRNDFLTNREIKEKLVCLGKEKKLQNQRLKSLLNQVKNSQKNVLDRMGNANILNLLKQSINFYKKIKHVSSKKLYPHYWLLEKELMLRKARKYKNLQKK